MVGPTSLSRTRGLRGLVTLAAIAVLSGYAWTVLVPAARNPFTSGFAAYYASSRVLLGGVREEVPRLYDDTWFEARIEASGLHGVVDIFAAQPPTMALFMTPFAWLSPLAARVAWTVASVGFWLGGVALLVKTLTGTKATVRGVVVVAAATALYRPLRESFDRGQCYAMLFFLLAWALSGLAAAEARRGWAAGVPLGILLVLKSAGAWLFLMLVLSRRWRPALAAVATYAAVATVSLVVIPLAAWPPFLRALLALSHDPSRYISAYQTVIGLFGHLFVLSPPESPHPIVAAPGLAAVGPLVVMLAAAVQSLRFGAASDVSQEARLLRLAVFDALVVTLAPIAEGYHYVLVLPAVIIAVRWAAVSRAGLGSRAALGLALLLLTVPQRMYFHPAIQAGALAVFAYPRVFGAFLLWGWLGAALTGEVRMGSIGSPPGHERHTQG